MGSPSIGGDELGDLETENERQVQAASADDPAMLAPS